MYYIYRDLQASVVYRNPDPDCIKFDLLATLGKILRIVSWGYMYLGLQN